MWGQGADFTAICLPVTASVSSFASDEVRGPARVPHFPLRTEAEQHRDGMIDKAYVESVVSEWLAGTDYFLVDLSVGADNNIAVVIDHAEGVWIDDCAELSRHIEARLDRDKEDYELEVGSAGLGQPFKVRRQWEIHVGKPVEAQMRDGRKLRGTLASVGEDTFELDVSVKVKPEGAKRPHTEVQRLVLAYADVANARYVIEMK